LVEAAGSVFDCVTAIIEYYEKTHGEVEVEEHVIAESEKSSPDRVEEKKVPEVVKKEEVKKEEVKSVEKSIAKTEVKKEEVKGEVKQ
jgi:hypothetical protein